MGCVAIVMSGLPGQGEPAILVLGISARRSRRKTRTRLSLEQDTARSIDHEFQGQGPPVLGMAQDGHVAQRVAVISVHERDGLR